MATRKNLPNGKAEITLSVSEQIALQQIIDKISREKLLTTLDQYRRAGGFHQLFQHDRCDGDYRIIF